METDFACFHQIDIKNQYKASNEPENNVTSSDYFCDKSFNIASVHKSVYLKQEVKNTGLTEQEEIEKLLNMDFPKRKDGRVDGRNKEYRKLLALANKSPFPIK